MLNHNLSKSLHENSTAKEENLKQGGLTVFRTAANGMNAHLHEAFELAGLKLSASGHYSGTFDGAEVRIYSRPVKLSSHSKTTCLAHDLNVFLCSPLKTRANLTFKGQGFLGSTNQGASDQELVVISEFAEEDVCFTAADKSWAERVAAEAKGLMLFIVQQEGLRFFRIEPEALHLALRLDWQSVTPEAINNWLEQLSDFAIIAESMDAPAELLKENRLESAFRLGKGRLARLSSAQLLVGGVALAVFAFFGLAFWFLVAGL